MPKIGYLMSSVFNYSKLIAPDAGSQFACEYGWPIVTRESLNEMKFDVIVVDQRHQPSEFDALMALKKATDSAFVFRIVDPYWPVNRDQPWYRFVREIADQPKVHFMLTYQPVEITGLLWSNAWKSRIIFAPYLYDSSEELALDHDGRFDKCLLSGSVDRLTYPLRHSVSSARQLLPPLRLFLERLEHPGYSDLGRNLRHRLIGRDYIKYLQRYKFAFTCSSRARLEFLKYREIAYAGCVLVGDMPVSLLDCPKNSFVGYRKNWPAMLREVFVCRKQSEDVARRYRKYLKQKRNKEVIGPRVNRQLEALA